MIEKVNMQSKHKRTEDESVMSNGCKKHTKDDGVIGFVAIIFLAVIMIPIAGAYLFFFGKSEKQRVIGLVLLIFYLICWIVSKF